MTESPDTTDTTDTYEQDLKRRQTRRNIFIVVGIMALGLAGAASFMLLGGTLGDEKVELGRAFLADCAAGRYEAAHERLSAEVRARVPLDPFKKIVAGDKRLTTYQKMGVSHQTHGGGKDYFEGKLAYQGGSVKAQIFFTKERGSWKISGVVVGNRDLFSGP